MTAEMKPQAVVVGAGPAGLMAAQVLADAGLQVTVIDRMPSAGRKLLMAGRGGLNLTHSEAMPAFMARYREAALHLRGAIDSFPPDALRRWAEGFGQETFVGSSGRVFPKAMKASPLLRAWLRRLDGARVRFLLRHEWLGWNADGRLLLKGPQGEMTLLSDATILALGGASWPRLGSDGGWVEPLANEGIAVTPLAPSNGGVVIAWSDLIRERFHGQPLKRLALTCGAATVRGEAMITRNGLEGGGVYALSPALRMALSSQGPAALTIDLRPDMTVDTIAAKLAIPRGKQSLANLLRKALRLSPVEIALLHEAAGHMGAKLAAIDPTTLARLIKGVTLMVTGLAPLDRAISTAGGVSFDALDDDLMIRNKPGVFVAGEMLDWDAPTGGYLLQASFATGRLAARGALRWLAGRQT